MSWEGWLWTQFGANPSLVSNSLFSGNLPEKFAGKGPLGRLHSQIKAVFQWLKPHCQVSGTGNF